MPTPHTKTPVPDLLETMTVENVRAFNPEVVVIPIGLTEPQGFHLGALAATAKVEARGGISRWPGSPLAWATRPA